MIQAPSPAAVLHARLIRRWRGIAVTPAMRAIVTRPGLREDVRFFLLAYAAGLAFFLTWLA